MPDTAPPIFTIGRREVLLQDLTEALEKDIVLLKLGQEKAGHQRLPGSFTGGIVFQNPKEARKYINEEWPEEKRPEMAVFEVQASWEHDCYSQGEDMYWKYLLFCRPITLLVEG